MSNCRGVVIGSGDDVGEGGFGVDRGLRQSVSREIHARGAGEQQSPSR